MERGGNILISPSHHITQCSLLYLKSGVEHYTEDIMESFHGVGEWLLNLVMLEGM